MGFLYIIRGGKDIYKIGITKSSPAKRLRTLQTGNANKLTLVKVYRRKDYKQLETRLHRTFANRRLSGEWFNLKLETITNEVEKGNSVMQNLLDLIAYMWTMAIGLFVLFLIALVIDGIFLGGNLITFVLDMFY